MDVLLCPHGIPEPAPVVTVHLHPIFVRFALLRYREYTSEGETNESGTHLNGYSYELRVVYCLW
ncbi:hypothetical protein BMS3Abin13_00978 [bacterium BMS3Abin13]|nr:hypothetical protein BMS3Abin13_00978 [bacterium BMS3Abin13]